MGLASRQGLPHQRRDPPRFAQGFVATLKNERKINGDASRCPRGGELKKEDLMHAESSAKFPSLSCNLDRVCQMPFAACQAPLNPPRACPLWGNSGHCGILARVGLSANDPKRTFGSTALHTEPIGAPFSSRELARSGPSAWPSPSRLLHRHSGLGSSVVFENLDHKSRVV